MTRHILAATVAAMLIPIGAVVAQDDSTNTTRVRTPNGPRGLYFAIDAELFRPEESFQSYIGRPTGVAGHLTVPVWTRGSTSLGIRGDAFWVRHFNKELTYDVSVYSL